MAFRSICISRRFTPRGGYLAFLGRISPEKRLDRAIEIARAAGFPLKIAAKVDAVDVEYFESAIKPLLHGDDIQFVGEISDREKAKFLGEASALLFPIDWPEPFGMVMIEAMACGTPVLAFDHGSVREVVDDGITGYVVNSVESAIADDPSPTRPRSSSRSPSVRRAVHRNEDGEILPGPLCALVRDHGADRDAHEQSQAVARNDGQLTWAPSIV